MYNEQLDTINHTYTKNKALNMIFNLKLIPSAMSLITCLLVFYISGSEW